ncbi:MAG: membrane protein insertion efficiency factor YidD [Ruminococcaceae bacterium]|nr:membrane protein insertion efficiency factor YidD [Oscillospiraceae bacterium]
MQNDIDFFRKEYRRQKKLEEIVHSRSLTRPNTKKWQVALAFAIFPILSIMAVFLSLIIKTTITYKMLLLFGMLILVVELYLRFCLIQTVKCYQHYASEAVRRRCLCIPSCSEYAIASLQKFPLMIALIKIRKRLYKTCKGEEYTLDFPCKKMNVHFEKEHL